MESKIRQKRPFTVCSHMLFRSLATPQHGHQTALSALGFEREVKITETVLFGQAVPSDCFKIVYILLRILLRFAGLASRFPLLLALHALSHAPNRNRHIIQKSSLFFYVSASCTNLLYRWKFFPFCLCFCRIWLFLAF